MRTRILIIAGALLTLVPLEAQTTAYRAPRAKDGTGHPDLAGIYQALNTANWDLLDHPASQGPTWQLGAIGAEPAGQGVVIGNAIPYTPKGLAQKQTNFSDRQNQDPEAKCYMPGIPRAAYMPFPFQIIQSNKDILMVYEFASANRLINMGKPKPALTDTWMGTSNGHWEGDTLVVDVTGLNGLAWFDRVGDYASDKVHVVERFTRTADGILNYEATIEDPSVFTKSWKISMPLYRRAEKNAQLLEFKCVEFAEQLLYGKYVKEPAPAPAPKK